MPEAVTEITSAAGNPNPNPDAAAAGADDGTEIRIGDRVFKGVNAEKEAREYAVSENQRIKSEKEIAEAYAAGLERGVQPGQQPPATAAKTSEQIAKEKKDWEERFYADPAAALEEEKQKLAVEIEQRLTAKRANEDADAKLWQEFYKKNPDLVGFEDDANLVVTRHMDELRAITKTKGKDAGFDFIAQKMKAKFQSYVEAQKSRRDLPNNGGGASGSAGSSGGDGGGTGGSGARVTTDPAQKPVAFVDQIRNMRKSKGLAG